MMCAGIGSVSAAADSLSLEISSGNSTRLVRIGAQWKWDRYWQLSEGQRIEGYWDLTLGGWRGDKHGNTDGRTQSLIDLGITPVFRWYGASGIGVYGEGGIGAHLLSEHYDNNGHQLSTNLQFATHISVGYAWKSGLDVGLKIQHLSNGGIRQPNSGVNFAGVRIAYPF